MFATRVVKASATDPGKRIKNSFDVYRLCHGSASKKPRSPCNTAKPAQKFVSPLLVPNVLEPCCRYHVLEAPYHLQGFGEFQHMNEKLFFANVEFTLSGTNIYFCSNKIGSLRIDGATEKCGSFRWLREHC